MPFDANATEAFLSKRVEAERELGRRSFYDFYQMSWPIIDAAQFVPGKHIRVISYHLQLAARREIRKLLICIPPRYSKSLLCSVAFPAWVWTWWPSAKFITCSFDQRLAGRDSLATRRLVEHPWYRARWPEVRLQRDQNQKMFYQTTAGGQRFVGSPQTGVTGHGADFAEFDDPHDVVNAESEADRIRAISFWFESMSSRFNDPEQGVSIVVGQRVNQSDVQGECIRRGYHHVILPARYEPDHPERHGYDWRKTPGEPLWPEKFTDGVLEGLWETLRDYAVAGQQQQRPTAREGGLFKREWFEIVDTMPDEITWARGWDWAGTEKSIKADPDWSVGVKLGKHNATNVIYIASVVRFRADPGGVQQRVKAVAQQDGPATKVAIPQDPAQAGKFQAQQYVTQVLPGYPVTAIPQSATKMDRADPFAAQCKMGNVKIYRANWNDMFLDELTSFPAGSHDDQVDAVALGYMLLMDNTTGILDFMRQSALASRAPMVAVPAWHPQP
jgi:predicted phage terminase large subunit-like protein